MWLESYGVWLLAQGIDQEQITEKFTKFLKKLYFRKICKPDIQITVFAHIKTLFGFTTHILGKLVISKKRVKFPCLH